MTFEGFKTICEGIGKHTGLVNGNRIMDHDEWINAVATIFQIERELQTGDKHKKLTEWVNWFWEMYWNYIPL